MVKKIFVLFLASLIFFIIPQVQAQSLGTQVTGGTSFDSAVTISTGKFHLSHHLKGSQYEYFKMPVKAGQIIDVSLQSQTCAVSYDTDTDTFTEETSSCIGGAAGFTVYGQNQDVIVTLGESYGKIANDTVTAGYSGIMYFVVGNYQQTNEAMGKNSIFTIGIENQDNTTTGKTSTSTPIPVQTTETSTTPTKTATTKSKSTTLVTPAPIVATSTLTTTGIVTSTPVPPAVVAYTAPVNTTATTTVNTVMGIEKNLAYIIAIIGLILLIIIIILIIMLSKKKGVPPVPPTVPVSPTPASITPPTTPTNPTTA